MFRKRLKHYSSIGVGSGIVLLCFILLTQTQTQSETQPETPVSEDVSPGKPTDVRGALPVSPRGFRKTVSTQQETLTDFQKSEFYHTIVGNNLFRPLGWRPPRPRESYRLLGTMIPTDEKTGTRAILQTTRGNITRTVTVGDIIDKHTTVIDIQAKQVTLEKAGQQRTLKLNPTPWLK